MEGATSTAAGIYFNKAFFLKFLSMFTLGAIGSLIMSVAEPPKTKQMLFFQAFFAGFFSMLFGNDVVRIFDYYMPFVDLTKVSTQEYFEWAAGLYFITGALSWGVIGFLLNLKEFIQTNKKFFKTK